MVDIAPKVAVHFEAIVRAALPALLSVALCASAAVASAADNAAVGAPGAATAPATAAAPVDASAAIATEEKRQRIEFLAKRHGYKTIERDGQRLFCIEEDLTGSRVRKQRSCVTENQFELQMESEGSAAREILDKGLRGYTPRTP